jgi:hydroxymethylpyrimidine pyrophosphatase-like HAD family hydrolase
MERNVNRQESEIKAVLYDVDNTAYCNGHNTIHTIAKRTLNALDIASIPATARSIPLMQKFEAQGVRIPGLGSLDSGATVYDFPTNEIVEKSWLLPGELTDILLKVGQFCDGVSVATPQERIRLTPSDLHPGFRQTVESPTVFGIYPLSNGERIEELLRSVEGISYRFMKYDNSKTQGCFQVTREGIDKGTGATRVAKLAGLATARLVAIGDDSAGDAPLFKAVKAMNGASTTVAMGNGDKGLKKMADMTVRGIDDVPDGMTDAMRRLSLVEI